MQIFFQELPVARKNLQKEKPNRISGQLSNQQLIQENQ